MGLSTQTACLCQKVEKCLGDMAAMFEVHWFDYCLRQCLWRFKLVVYRSQAQGIVMRKSNWRVVMAGGMLLALVAVFFFIMMDMAPKSNDPVELMRTVGTVSGIVSGVALAMIVFGYIGRKV